MATASGYLDGIVSAMARVGNLIVTMGLISGLILVVLYVENYSINDNLYSAAQSIRGELGGKVSEANDHIKAIDVYYSRTQPQNRKLLSGLRVYCEGKRYSDLSKCRETLFVELKEIFQVGDDTQDRQLLAAMAPVCKNVADLALCRQQLIDEKSGIEFRIRRIDNEMQFVNLGRVKLPFLGYEMAANDAPVVLGFFLVIFASVTLITVHHLKVVFGDQKIRAQVKKDLLLLRARLVLIYAPTNRGFISFLTKASFFMPCCVMSIATFNVARRFWHPEILIRQHIHQDAIVQCAILLLMTVFLSYLGIFLVRGWAEIGQAINKDLTSTVSSPV